MDCDLCQEYADRITEVVGDYGSLIDVYRATESLIDAIHKNHWRADE